LLNTAILARYGEAFDPYPYISLNLILSTVAALQAPIILMSQNRQAVRDRLAANLTTWKRWIFETFRTNVAQHSVRMSKRATSTS